MDGSKNRSVRVFGQGDNMTTIIIGLIAALGIGGGLVIANNSGGHDSHSAIVDTNTGDAQNLVPNYELISALTDKSQYNITLSTSSSLAEQFQTAGLMAAATPRALPSIDDPRYGNYEDDLENGDIRGNQIEGTDVYSTLSIKDDTGKFAIVTSKAVSDNGQLKQEAQQYELQYEDNTAKNNRYWTFSKVDNPVEINTNEIAKHYNSVHLGGAALGLTTADFGQWEEKGWRENGSGTFQGNYVDGYRTFFFYDDQYAYKGNYNKDTVNMGGNVLVAALPESVQDPYNLQTGSISFTLDLANNQLLNGNVVMDDAAYQELYNVSGFTGTLSGSIFSIDGTGWHGDAPEAGALRGGVGKLLIGKDGLEAVGNFTKQIVYEGGDGDEGKADYTFGAKENN